MIAPGRYLAAYVADWIAGDPPSFPHPVRLIGAATSAGERFLRRPAAPSAEIVQGAALTALIAAGSWAAARYAIRATGATGEIVLAWTTLAVRSLLDHSAAVIRALESGDLALARRRVALIVGRDVDQLDESEIARAVIETVAEGLCDGVVAPLFYLTLGGVPLACAYKAVNTLDSMIGHPEPPYRYFGRVAARLDDVANFIPARIAACAICAGALLTANDWRSAWSTYRRDGDRHPSPNAGRPEAAMAGALGVRLGGNNSYGGKPSPKPVLGGEGRAPDVRDARRSLGIAAAASVAAFAMGFAWLAWRRR